jgi:hypothetical protein
MTEKKRVTFQVNFTKLMREYEKQKDKLFEKLWIESLEKVLSKMEK